MKKIYLLTIVISILLCTTVLYAGCGNATGGGGGGGGGGTSVGNGILYVADYNHNMVYVYDNACTRDTALGTVGPSRVISSDAMSTHINSNCLFIDPASDTLYVACTGSILAFKNASKADYYAHAIHLDKIITSSGKLTSPKGIFVKDNKIYVADCGVQKIEIFNNVSGEQTTPLATISSSEMLNPYSVYVNSNNDMYVGFFNHSLSHNNQIYVFNNVSALTGDHNIVPDRVIKRTSTLEGYFPAGIWVDESRDILFASSPWAGDNYGSIEVFEHASSLDGVCYPSYEAAFYDSRGIAYDHNKDIIYAIPDSANSISVWDNASTIEGTNNRHITCTVSSPYLIGLAIDTTRP